MNKLLLRAASYTVVALSLDACNGGGTTLSGGVYMGKVANAQVALYQITADGAVALSPIAVTRTDANGTFSVSASPRYPVLVRASGGTYIEEATGEEATLSTPLSAVYLSTPSRMSITPYSTAVVTDALARGGLNSANVTAAASRVSAFLGGIDAQQTVPVYSGTANGSDIPAGVRMAFALGAESQARTDAGLALENSAQNIATQAANGDTLGMCHTGAGNTSADGTVHATAGDACTVTEGAVAYAANALNRTGIASVDQLAPAQGAPLAGTIASGSCSDRVTLLANTSNLALFDSRRQAVQATLVGDMTASNWSTYPTPSTWGPFATRYGTLQMPAGCTGADALRELVMAVENYWVDQNVNYCHHHIPGWLPPEGTNTSGKPYRDSTPGSTLLTCTAQRGANGAQSIQLAAGDAPAAFPASSINWHGVDCSDFTSWAYNFAGITANDLSTGIGTQACSTADNGGTDAAPSPGVLLDINQANIGTMESYLRPGDLLYITQENPTADAGQFTGDYKISHVVTWTGKHWSDLQAGADASRYDINRIGQPDSRLGGDFRAHFPPGFDFSQLGATPTTDPWMILDSHFAGPAYRPFLLWYRTHLSHVRRIIGADDARADPVLSAYVIKPISRNAKRTLITLGSTHAGSTATSGYRMTYENGGKHNCYRAGTAQ
ncbi:hypothetical protein WKR88_24950 [Trinickia caryophylli]|uniref:Uncharacterized protein n=1 Tax=Trinickia caryophylli TaxID=28094 RepID=A0A1X7G596_TRICW|nr:hypothetical protein [Trinickia caryophylli]PMS13793.1 hypothetical protein C0Z17_02680 [Trinickia caryophylli]TRX14294.1 hypothetical protein FNF07_23665 [Trinickia caryophylli]WQE14122.1 hypothetical protein U0034_25855 [Trinickia caryophylli]SMF64044.1 hypothetical protein SAMN06295900_113150 [Trinickia caryophylli]GLU33380.1 lipoprotein [Trinickia caryophylli]